MPNEQKDVRVRFSAEGIAEVVSAFQKISSEGKKSAHETEGAFAQLGKQFEELGKNLLAGLSIVYVADGLKELFKQSLENAEALTRLSAQTGLSTAAIQAFAKAARETGVGTDVANAGIQRFTVAVGKAELGTNKTQAALSDLGINIKSFAALSADAKFQLVAERLAGIADPARRARDEVALFSKSGVELDQALVKIGQEGFDPFIAKLRELGVFLDDKTIAELKQTKERLGEIQSVAQGLGTQLLVGLVPALEKVATAMAKISGGGEFFKKLGAFAGESIRISLAALESWGALMKAGGKFASNAWNLDLRAAFSEAASQIRGIGDIWKEVHQDPTPPSPPDGGGGDDTQSRLVQEAIARAHVDLIKARLENELKLYEATDKLILQDLKANYDSGELSLKDYFAAREAIISAGFDKQIAITKAKLKAEEALPVDINDEAAKLQKATKEVQLRGQIAELNAQREAAIQQEKNSLTEQELKLQEQKATAEEKLLQIEGRRTDAARKRLEIEAQTLDRQLAAGGISPEERQTAKNTFLTQGGAAINYQDASEKAKADLSLLETQKKSIQDQVNAGQIYAIQGEERMQELERQRVPLLQQDAKAMLDFANTSKDPQLIASAEAFKEKVQQIGVGINQSAKYMKELRDGVQQAVGAGINSFLTDAILNSKSLGEAFHNAMKTMLADLARMAIQIEEEKFLKMLFSGGLFGSFGGGKGGGGVISDLGLGGGTTVNAASGGYVRGPGSTTSDSIPAMLSDREYIVSAKATQRPGVLSLLDTLNGGLRVPQFASGGYVSSIGGKFAGGSPRAASPILLNITPEALHYTMRDWFEREVADQLAKR